MKFQHSVRISAPAKQAWQVLGEQFGSIGEWTSAIETSHLEGALGPGAIRHCQIAAFGPVPAGVIQERLLEYDVKQMIFVYDVVAGMPAFVSSASNRWSVTAVDAKSCIVRSEASLELKGWMRWLSFLMRVQFGRGGNKTLEELKYRVETGTPHSRKRAASTKIALR